MRILLLIKYKDFDAGAKLSVPADISKEEAETLVKWKNAEKLPEEKQTKKRGK